MNLKTLPVMLLAVSCLGVGVASAETLDQALADAWRNNPQLLAARAGQSAAQSDVRAAKGGWYPKLALTGGVGRDSTSGMITFFNPPENFDANLQQSSIALRLDQPIYQGGRLSAKISAAENDASASHAMTHAHESQILLQAVAAYLGVIEAEKLLAIQDENVGVIHKQLDAAKQSLAHGEGTRTDVAQADSRLQAAIASRIRTNSMLAQARAHYRTVIGHEPGTLSVPPTLPSMPANLAAAEALAGHNYNVVAARFNAQAASARADEASSAVWPKIGLFAEVRRENQPQYGFNRLDDRIIGLSISIPIWEGGSLRAKTSAAKERAREADLDARATEEDARDNVVAAWQNYTAAEASLTAIKAQLDAARIAYDGVRDEHRQGERTLLDVLNADQEIRNAQAALIEATRDRIVAGYALLAATGELSAATLSLPVADANGQNP
ncbi:MAG: TolC family outer membrane protein [Gammaproteobacteria bacterium]